MRKSSRQGFDPRSSEGLPLGPAGLFDAFTARRQGAVRRQLGESFAVVALPGERLDGDLREGDLVIRRALGEGSLAWLTEVGVAAPPALEPGVRLPFDHLVLRPAGEQDPVPAPAPDSPVANRFIAAHPSRFCAPGQPGSLTCRSLASPRPIRRVIIHVLAVPSTSRRSGVEAVVAGWQNAGREASSHYLVDRDGTITQMVREADVAFHTPGNNPDSIGIEHADVCNDPAPLTLQLYERSAALVRDVAARNGFVISETTVLGHHDANPNHGDPGPYWDWEYYRLLLVWDGQDRISRPVRGVSAAAGAPGAPAGWQVGSRRAVPDDHCASRRDPWGAHYWKARPAATGTAAELTLVADEPGTYSVSLWWPDVVGANPAVTVEIETGCISSPCRQTSSTQTVTIDQRRNFGRWNFLATVTVDGPPAEVKVRLRRDSAQPGWILCDGVRLLRIATMALQPAGTGPLGTEREREDTGTVDPDVGPLDPRELIDPHIDVDAQRSLRRLSLADEASSRDAHGMFRAVKSRELAGIYAVDQQVPALRAQRMGRGWWQLIPEGEDAVLVLEAGEPVSPPPVGDRAPLIAFRETLREQHERLDSALRKAWESFQSLRGGQLVCEPGGPDGPASTAAGVESEPGTGLLANIVPVLCQLRPPRPRPPVPPVAADPWATADSTGNVLLFPARRRPTHNEPLAHLRGGLVTDSSLRPRVSAILGPGATPRGLARLLRPLYRAATPGQGQGPAPTEDELAQAILVYSENYLPLSDLRNWRDGLRLPLPIEIDVQTGEWVLNSNLALLWAGTFPAAGGPMLDRRASHLDQPDETALAAEVTAFLAANPDALSRGIALSARILANPFDAVFFAFELLRQLGAAAFDAVLALLDNAVSHQMALLASLTAGNAILRRLLAVLDSPPAKLSAAQQASLTRGLAMLRGALGVGGALTVPRELPETPQQRARRPGRRPAGGRALPRDPAEGEHRMVLGRDVLVGVVDTFTQSNGNQFTGPSYVGRMPPRPFFDAHRTDPRFPQGDAAFAARTEIVLSIAGNEGLLDAIRMQDAGILSTGIQQWSAHVDLELAAFLQRFKTLAPDEHMLFFSLYGLEVRGSGRSFMLQRVQPDGTVVDLPLADRRDFFGGSRTGNHTTFQTHWAARVREASIASVSYKVAQILQGAARFDRILADVGRLNVTLAGTRRRLPLNQVITSQLGAALILDSHINQPGNVARDLQASADAAGDQPNADRLDRAITTAYTTRRHTNDRNGRNAFILGLGLDTAHGSFAGW